MAPAAAWSRSRSRPGRTRMLPLKPSSTKRSSGSHSKASLAMRCVTASSWLAIVSSLACCSPETRA